jgi:hypothetical protein
MPDERVLVSSQSLAAPVPTPEPGATTSAVSEPGSPLPSDPIARSESEVSGTPVRRLNYVVRHWRGDLSLPVSYWINNLVATIAVSILFRKVASVIGLSDDPLIFAATITLISLVVIAVSIWQLVGIWRSAGKHRARGGTRFWVWAARFAVVTGFLGFAWTVSQEDLPKLKEFWCIAAGDPCIGTHALHVLRGGTELELVGGIKAGLTKEVMKLLGANPKIQVIRLEGPGGRIGEAHELRKLIDERGLITYVGSICASACTIAFLGGSQRYLAPARN